jgi:hypothetical protein
MILFSSFIFYKPKVSSLNILSYEKNCKGKLLHHVMQTYSGVAV